MQIIKFKTNSDMRIKFLDKHGYETNTTYENFKKGTIKNPYDPSVFGYGYLGEGGYKTMINKVTTKEYQVWNNLIARCYSEKQRKLHKAYGDCEICEEWHNFQTFAKWFNENYYTIPNERVELDKDILIKGNRLYSPDTCLFVPQTINLLFVNRRNYRGNDPLGVRKTKSGKYTVTLGCNKKIKHLGHFKTSEEAFQCFKVHKEAHVREMAEKYKSLIPKLVYQALYKYQFEITD